MCEDVLQQTEAISVKLVKNTRRRNEYIFFCLAGIYLHKVAIIVSLNKECNISVQSA
jgi:hypothetical protein